MINTAEGFAAGGENPQYIYDERIYIAELPYIETKKFDLYKIFMDFTLELQKELENELKASASKIELSLVRLGGKTRTQIIGLNLDITEMKRINRDLMKKCCCSGTVTKDEDNDEVLQISLQGDQREPIIEYLTCKMKFDKHQIRSRGV